MLLEWACQVTFPIDDSFSIGILYSGATFFSSIIGEVLTMVVNGDDNVADKYLEKYYLFGRHGAFLGLLSLSVIAIVATIFAMLT